jgi:hypothetical protein
MSPIDERLKSLNIVLRDVMPPAATKHAQRVICGPAYQRRQATGLIDARAIRRHRLQTVDTRVYSLCTLLTDRSGRIHPG